MISSRLNVLACQRPSLFEIHTAFREEMLKPFDGKVYRRRGFRAKMIGVVVLKEGFSFWKWLLIVILVRRFGTGSGGFPIKETFWVLFLLWSYFLTDVISSSMLSRFLKLFVILYYFLYFQKHEFVDSILLHFYCHWIVRKLNKINGYREIRLYPLL